MRVIMYIILSVCAVMLSSAILGKTVSVLPKERIAYAIEYDANRVKMLGQIGDEMGETEALQAVAVHFARKLEQVNGLFARLEQQTRKLEADMSAAQKWMRETEATVKDQETRIKKLEDRVSGLDEDLAKIFGWANDVDDELHNKLRIGGIYSELNQVKESCGKITERVNENSAAIKRNSQNIRDVVSVLQRLR